MAKNMSRAGRLAMIMTVIANNPGISTHALAKACHMTNSAHFRGMVCELFDKGLIMAEVDNLLNKRQRYRWYTRFD